jgi:hypothetical protein
MKNTIIIILSALLIPFAGLDAQSDSLKYQNSVLNNFEHFSTPRTSGRPGAVYRINPAGKRFIVEDVNSIQSLKSSEGTIKGRMNFPPQKIMEVLNLEFNGLDPVPVEVEIIDAVREYTEQTKVDRILWENDKIEELVVDEKSTYFLIRETISSNEIIYRFSKETVDALVRGKNQLTEARSVGDTVLDYPFEIKREFDEPRRLFHLDQKIELDYYGD